MKGGSVLILISMVCCVVLMMGLMVSGIGLVLGFRSMSKKELSSPFECGFDPVGSSRIGFSIRFFLILVLFVIFDFETVLVIPSVMWLTEGMEDNWSLFCFFGFLIMLFLSILFEMKEGVLQWKD
uniref:NADH-ubiquinone oxidoreductase chain 3 n=1 Tax=Utterbackia peninsularis TaxID=872316 RepID=F4ZG72_9BIVA|nr:NADH dehydrogenase subunit 3 [Utterbackia peninsularis]ADL62598.1 NADH dehydrogenase subunit 3 [Utterbackia peninsularis]